MVDYLTPLQLSISYTNPCHALTYAACSVPENPKWWMVDVQLVRGMTHPVSLDAIKRAAAAGGAGDTKPGKHGQTT